MDRQQTAIVIGTGAGGATILPRAMGNPPILTIMALAKRIAKNIIHS